jgi:hypothetical protein
MPGIPGGQVKSMVVYDDGTGSALYVAGDFDQVGGIAASNIARYDGESFAPLGEGITGSWFNGYVNAMAVYDDGNGPALYVGGFFDRAGGLEVGYCIAKWDGQEWSAVGEGLQGVTPQVWDMAVFSGDLYIAGNLRSPGGQSNDGIVRWDGQSFSTVGGGLGGSLPIAHALAVFQGPGDGDRWLAVGGNFELGTDYPIRDLALWNGEAWEAAGTGIGPASGAYVTELAVHDDGAGPFLCVAGSFSTAGGVPVMHAARWSGGNAWAPLGDNLYTLPIIFGTFDEGDGPQLYASGPSHVVRWSANTWKPIGSNWSGGARAFCTFDDGEGEAMFVGGVFTTIEGRPAHRLATWRCLNPLGDVNGDGVVDIADLVELLAAWGECPPSPGICPADLDYDGTVGVLDLLLLLAQWS